MSILSSNNMAILEMEQVDIFIIEEEQTTQYTTEQTMIYKTFYRKLEIDHH
jgi:hypothetical protein